jgi:hypothetical protein
MTKQRKKPEAAEKEIRRAKLQGKGPTLKEAPVPKQNTGNPNPEYSFPNGNGFWKLRSKHGVDKIFATPEIMWEAACEYFLACEENPLIEVDFKGKDSERVHIPRMRAFTMERLCLFLDVHKGYFLEFKKALKDDQLGRDFSRVITRIEQTIYSQKFEGASAGFLNANIIARDLGLKDTVVNEVDDKRKQIDELFPKDVDPGSV